MRVRIGTVVRALVVLVCALMCIMAILQPQNWLFLFRKSFTSAVALAVLFLLWGIAGKLK